MFVPYSEYSIAYAWRLRGKLFLCYLSQSMFRQCCWLIDADVFFVSKMDFSYSF